MGTHRRRRGPWPPSSIIAPIVLLTALMLGAAGCTDDASTAAANSAATTSAPTRAEPAAPEKATVDIVDKTLSTDDAVIKEGGTATWINSDTVDHEIVSLDSDVIRSPVLGQGGVYTALFSVPGEYPYYCNIHNFMKGTVVVR